jgi:hypothetical protein
MNFIGRLQLSKRAGTLVAERCKIVFPIPRENEPRLKTES